MSGLTYKDNISFILVRPKESGNIGASARAIKNMGFKNLEEECGFLITISSDPSSPSLNLAQSVMLVAYELSQKSFKTIAPELVSNKELDTLYRHINAILRLLEYIPRGNRELETRIMRNLKHLIGRAGLTGWELRMIHGICSQIEKKIV
jgi:tRNA C32,U32 (ribose-2'-O)-methylase TrmJ